MTWEVKLRSPATVSLVQTICPATKAGLLSALCAPSALTPPPPPHTHTYTLCPLCFFPHLLLSSCCHSSWWFSMRPVKCFAPWCRGEERGDGDEWMNKRSQRRSHPILLSDNTYLACAIKKLKQTKCHSVFFKTVWERKRCVETFEANVKYFQHLLSLPTSQQCLILPLS